MKLTQEQINYLFSFCAEQGIIHYDVQIEMVDHFTEWIETNWEKQPLTTFTLMVEQLKNAFPKNELGNIATEKEKALKKELWSIYKKEFISFFSLPKITLSFLLFVLFFIFPWNKEKDIYQLINIPFQIVNIYMFVYYLTVGKNIIAKNKDDLLTPLLIHKKLNWFTWMTYGAMALLFYLILTLSLFFNITSANTNLILILKILLPFMMIAMISYIHVSVNVNKKIRSLYPTAFARS